MINLSKENYLQILFFLSISILIAAFSIQYLFGYQPCNLCVIERIPYILTIIIVLLSYKYKKDQLFYSILLLLVFSFSFLISVYHFGIEQGFIEESSVCVSKNIDSITKEEVLKSLKQLNISCKDVTFRIFHLSLTTYNIFISIVMFLISTKIFLITNEIKQ